MKTNIIVQNKKRKNAIELSMKAYLNLLLIFFLLFSFVNRSLFVSMTEADFVCPSQNLQQKNEINSLLELVLMWTGYGENEIDEDGDSQENYTTFQFIQPLLYQDFAQILNNLFSKDIKRTLCVFSNMIYSQPFCGQIDHPPEG